MLLCRYSYCEKKFQWHKMLRGIKKLISSRFLTNTYFLIKNVELHSRPDFTKNTHKVTRGYYNTLEENHIQFFYQLLGERRVIMNVSDLEKYNVDWFKHLRGNSNIVVKPKTTEEVSKILAFCNQNRLAVCPQGGNTSVVGGSVPVFDEIIINTDLMNEIISLDDTSGVLVCQSGCILENLNTYVGRKGLIMPLDLGAKGSCHIGGNIATNAGGLRLLRYGNLHGNVLGLEVVKADGEILDCLSTLKKDNTGYHLKNIFIGSEGTLGFVTKAAIQCPPKPRAVSLAFLGLQSYEKVLKAYKFAKYNLSEILSAVEVMDSSTMQLVNQHLNLQSPIGDYPFYLLIETSGSNEEHDLEKLNAFLDSSLQKHFVLNGTVTSEPSKCQAIWKIRESIPEAFHKDGYVFMYDFSLPLQNYYALANDVKEYMGKKAHRVFGFGHLGDGNLHFHISIEKYSTEIKNYIEPYIFHKVIEMDGSISAEHGIGFLKSKHLHLTKTNAVINLMQDLKDMLDPNGILNPYKVLQLDVE